MNLDRYRSIRQKCVKISSILRDISVVIGTMEGRWVKLETGETIMPGLGLIHEAKHLLNCARYVQQGIFRIVAVGACKTGKSTFLNALLGEHVLPTARGLTTGVITNVTYGSSPTVMIYEEGREQLYPVDRETFVHNFTLNQKTIDLLDPQGRIETNLKRVRYAQLEYSSSLLDHCMRLTDTPGITVSIHHPVVTPLFLKRQDVAIIVTLNAMHPFPQDVQTYLKATFELKKHTNVFFVVNRVDQMPPEKVDALKRHVRAMLRQHFLDESFLLDDDLYKRRVFFVSAEHALNDRADRSRTEEESQENADFLTLQNELAHFLNAEDRMVEVLEPTLRTVEHVVERAFRQIMQERASLPEEDGEFEESFALVRKRRQLDTIEKKLQILVDEVNRVVFGRLTSFSDRKIQTGPLNEIVAKTSMHLDIEDHLHFIRQVIERVPIPSSTRQEFQDDIEELFYRQIDPYLYMAVIGEFNSGKSTFISALLRQELLKTSALIATAMSTRIRYGLSPDIVVLFKKQKEALSYSKHASRLWQLIKFFTGQQQMSEGGFRECLHALTATDAIASHIEDLLIVHPAFFLSEGIVIIDTPGLNAENPEHAKITTNIIQHEADITVALIPASFPLSMMLKEFLTEQLFPLHNRCLFILTQMDKVEVEQQERVVEYTRTQLSRLTGIAQPAVLYEASARSVLDILADPQMVGPEMSVWNDRFIELEDRIWKYLQRERILSISERFLLLLNRLFERLDEQLKTCQTDQEDKIQEDLREIRQRRLTLQEKRRYFETL